VCAQKERRKTQQSQSKYPNTHTHTHITGECLVTLIKADKKRIARAAIIFSFNISSVFSLSLVSQRHIVNGYIFIRPLFATTVVIIIIIACINSLSLSLAFPHSDEDVLK
jgi:hypothetical protein